MNTRYFGKPLWSAIAVCLILTVITSVMARPVKIWSAADLWNTAEVVVMATAKATETETQLGAETKPDAWVSVSTTFEVQAVLKGKADGGTVKVQHSRYFGKNAEITVVDGPSFVEFDPLKKNQYLVFLKRNANGRLEPVSGQYDPDSSFKLVQPYHKTQER